MRLALIGNPNTGKTSLFNALTGSYEYVGNWSGVTVEKKIGTLRGSHGHLIDLPGVYTLNPISRDEAVVSQFLLEESFDGIVNIVDASQLKRNLQLTIQLLEYGKPVMMALNMTDVAESRGIHVDAQELAKTLGINVVPIVARSGKGVEHLSNEITQFGHETPAFSLHYGTTIEKAISDFIALIPDQAHYKRWLALQYLEGNPQVEAYVSQFNIDTELKHIVEATNTQLQTDTQQSVQNAIYRTREAYIQDVLEQVIQAPVSEHKTLTDKLDLILTNRILGIPIFLGLLYIIFMLTFDWVGFPISDWLDTFFAGPLTAWTEAVLQSIGAHDFIQALILQGIIGGVGSVLVFVPQIFILFFFISLLEDSGYMARVATVMDRIMQSIGLNGKAFIPMIIGFGCNVPAVMAARTVEHPKERLLTILVTPLMSCSARLPIYALFASAFFSQHQALVVLSLYVLGVVLALILAKLLSKTVLQNEQSFFIIELPPYRLPQWMTLWRSTWDKGKGFLRKAGTFIFAGSVFIWLLSYTGPGGFDVAMDDSFLAMIGGLFAPLLVPLGFGTWQAGAALMTGFLAKEVVVSTMGIIYGTPESGLQDVLHQTFDPIAAYSFMVFILIYIPCLSTVAVINKETHSKKWTLFSVAYALILAYILSLLIYQVGQFIVG
ncbi:ferrous iron transport protein B [Lentibacillus saliphilus]|uniref:ferrous iron transport protein B n=1 Tax=Lentibacillus saliphilus TaxID=2737028 RepID=UPI001C2FBE30|nr:ferrous iron transport protein B [Lentibacillus saliphilus]